MSESKARAKSDKMIPGKIRARDVYFRLKDANVDPVVKELLAGIAEQQIALEQNQTELAMLLDQMTDIITGFTSVTTRMKEHLEKVRKGEADPEGDVLSTSGTTRKEH